MQKVLNFAATSIYVASCVLIQLRKILSKYVKERIVSLKESGLTNREDVETLKREGATVIRVTMQVVHYALNLQIFGALFSSSRTVIVLSGASFCIGDTAQ